MRDFGKISLARKALITRTAFSPAGSAGSAMRPTFIHFTAAHYLQESGAGASVWGSRSCRESMDSTVYHHGELQAYPQASGVSRQVSTVAVRVVIWKSGSVHPMRVVSGPTLAGGASDGCCSALALQPFVRDGEPIDVTTDIRLLRPPETGWRSHPPESLIISKRRTLLDDLRYEGKQIALCPKSAQLYHHGTAPRLYVELCRALFRRPLPIWRWRRN